MMGQRKTGLPQILGGCALWGLAKALETRGDMAPLVLDGVSVERLAYHLGALIVMIGAAVLFFKGGLHAFRRLSGRFALGEASDIEVAKVFMPALRGADAAGEFDADAALQRYLARKHADPAAPEPSTPEPPAAPVTFGRKQD